MNAVIRSKQTLERIQIEGADETQRRATELALHRVLQYDPAWQLQLSMIRHQRSQSAIHSEFFCEGRGMISVSTDIITLAVELAVRRNVMLGLRQLGAKLPPWGILEGVRPTKLAHRLAAGGCFGTAAVEQLENRYLLRRDKARRLVAICDLQRPLLQEVAGQVGIYIGIPFCPSRCTYCSFPGYLLRDDVQARQFLKVLLEEVFLVRQLLQRYGLDVATVYIGGGTPTVLPETEFSLLLQTVSTVLVGPKTREFTVEAGRPETLTLEKLRLMEKNKVSRISINPQTMHESTLKRIGRSHRIQDIINAFALARSADFHPLINTDVIVGLPGEGQPEVEATLASLALLRPDNITLHSLALKRGAYLRQPGDSAENKWQVSAHEAEAIFEAAVCGVEAQGLLPYYLYRQKNVAGLTENIGFCRPGTASIYNIMVMEEQNIILGLGPYATTKLVDVRQGMVKNVQHPKDLHTYMDKMIRLHGQRAAYLQQLCEAEGCKC